MATSKEAEIHKILSAVIQKRPILTMWEMCKQSAPAMLPQEVWVWYGSLSARQRQDVCRIDDKEWLATTLNMWQKARNGVLFLFVEYEGVSNRLCHRCQLLPDASSGGLQIRESLCNTKVEELINFVSFDNASFASLIPLPAAVRDSASIKNMITEVLYDGFRTTTEYLDPEMIFKPARRGSLSKLQVKLEFFSFGAFVAEKLQSTLANAYKNRLIDVAQSLPLSGVSEIVLVRERLSKFLLTISHEMFQSLFAQHPQTIKAEDIGEIIADPTAAEDFVVSLCSSHFRDFGSSNFLSLLSQFRGLSSAYAEAIASSFDAEDIKKAAEKAEIKRRRKLKQKKKMQLRKERKLKAKQEEEEERSRNKEQVNTETDETVAGEQIVDEIEGSVTADAADDQVTQPSCRRGRKKRRGRRKKKKAKKNDDPDAPQDEETCDPIAPENSGPRADSPLDAQRPLAEGPVDTFSERKLQPPTQAAAATPQRTNSSREPEVPFVHENAEARLPRSNEVAQMPTVPPALYPDDSVDPKVSPSVQAKINSPMTVGAKWMKNNSISLESHKRDVEKISKVLKTATSAPAPKTEEISDGVNLPSTSSHGVEQKTSEEFDTEAKSEVARRTPEIHQRILHFLMPRECGCVASVCTKWRRWLFVGFNHHSSFKEVEEKSDGSRVPQWQDQARSYTANEGAARKAFFGKSNGEDPPFWHWGVSPERHWKLHVELLDMTSSLVRISRQRRPFQLAVVNAARVAVLQLWPGASVEVFGSFKHGLCGPSSDVDLVICDVLEHYEYVFNSKSSANKESRCLIMLAEHLRTQDWAEEVQAITNAIVPVIKMSASFEEAGRGKIWLDISFVSPIHRGLSTCVFVNLQMSLHPKLLPLVLVLKPLLKTKGLNEPLSGGLSSYCLVLMVTAMLKLWKQYYPTVHPNLGTLFLFFFYLFGIVFDPAQDGITVAPTSSTPFFPRRGSMHLLTLFQFMTRHDPARAPAAVSIFLNAQSLQANVSDLDGRLPPLPPPRSANSRRRNSKRKIQRPPLSHGNNKDQHKPRSNTAHDMSLLEAASGDPGWWVNQKPSHDNIASNRSAQALYHQLRREYGSAPQTLLQRDKQVNMTQPKFEFDPLMMVDPLNNHNNLGSNCHAILPLRAQLALALQTAATAEMGTQYNILGAIFSASHHQRVIELQEKLWCPPKPLNMGVDDSMLGQTSSIVQSATNLTRHRREDSLPKSLAHSVQQALSHMMVSAERVGLSVSELHWLLPSRWHGWLARYVVHTYCVQRQCHDALLAFTLLFDLPQYKPTLTPKTRADSLNSADNHMRHTPIKSKYRNPFQRMVRRESIEYAIFILQAGVVITDTTTRKNLKICGRWIGLLTLARNKPLLQAELDLKKLLEPNALEHLTLAVPFIVQILMAAGQSRVFRPPNPWTCAMVKALRRTYHRPNLNLSSKYEIEVLCRHLGLSSPLHSVNYIEEPAALESWAADALCCLQRITAPRRNTSFQAREHPMIDRGTVMIQAAELDQLKELVRRYPTGGRTSLRLTDFSGSEEKHE